MVGMGEGCVVILAMGVGRGGWVMGGKPQLPRRRRRHRRRHGMSSEAGRGRRRTTRWQWDTRRSVLGGA